MGTVLKNKLLRHIVPDFFITHRPRMLGKKHESTSREFVFTVPALGGGSFNLGYVTGRYFMRPLFSVSSLHFRTQLQILEKKK